MLPACGSQILAARWRSWLLPARLAGAPACGQRAGPPALAVEAITAILLGADAAPIHPGLVLAAACWLVLSAVPLAFIDAAVRRPPDLLTAPAYAGTAVLLLAVEPIGPCLSCPGTTQLTDSLDGMFLLRCTARGQPAASGGENGVRHAAGAGAGLPCEGPARSSRPATFRASRKPSVLQPGSRPGPGAVPVGVNRILLAGRVLALAGPHGVTGKVSSARPPGSPAGTPERGNRG